jgi:hypothetical protein
VSEVERDCCYLPIVKPKIVAKIEEVVSGRVYLPTLRRRNLR